MEESGVSSDLIDRVKRSQLRPEHDISELLYSWANESDARYIGWAILEPGESLIEVDKQEDGTSDADNYDYFVLNHNDAPEKMVRDFFREARNDIDDVDDGDIAEKLRQQLKSIKTSDDAESFICDFIDALGWEVL